MRVFDGWKTWTEAEAALTPRLGQAPVQQLGQAYRYAADQHADQQRPAGEPYPWHLLEVVEILTLGLDESDPDLLTAGLLHDVVEDTDATLTDVKQRFGPAVAELVNQVTMPPLRSGDDKTTVRQTYLASLNHVPQPVLRLKLSDRYSNVQRLHTHPRVAKQRSYHAETINTFAPLAGRDPQLADLFTHWADAYDYLTGPVDTLEAVDKLAAAAHRGQIDKSGSPYIDHPRATARIAAANGATDHQRMAALLHDTVEDTSCTLDHLHDLDVPTPVITMVDALTHRPGEDQPTYLTRLRHTPDAVLVKRADIAHNQHPERFARLDPSTQQRLRSKYQTALDILQTTHLPPLDVPTS